MSKSLKTVHYSAPIEIAHQVLIENKIRHLPVVDENGGVVGILSDRDILRANVSTGTPGEPIRFPARALVADYMSTALQTIAVDRDLQEAMNQMLNEKVSSCLVESNGEIVGIVTYEDLVRLLNQYLTKPSGSFRSSLATFIATSPLGAISTALGNIGV